LYAETLINPDDDREDKETYEFEETPDDDIADQHILDSQLKQQDEQELMQR
jgi:hypothetical protein